MSIPRYELPQNRSYKLISWPETLEKDSGYIVAL